MLDFGAVPNNYDTYKPECQKTDCRMNNDLINNHAASSCHWYILGAGSLGCLWAAYLRQDNFPCTLILKDEELLAAFEKNNTIILEESGTTRSYSSDACLAKDINADISHLLLCTKAHQCLDALEPLRDRITDNTRLVLLHNGMGIQQEIAQRFPQSSIYCGVTTEGANRRGRFHVIHAGKGHTQIGLLEGMRETEPSIIKQLPWQSLSIHYNENITSALWYKLAINCAINGLTAIHGCRNGELARIKEARDQIPQICAEVAHVSLTLSIDWLLEQAGDESALTAYLTEQAFNVIEKTAENRSSMLQDIQHQRQTEINYINGYLCAQAWQLGIHVPANEKIVQAVGAMEAAYLS